MGSTRRERVGKKLRKLRGDTPVPEVAKAWGVDVSTVYYYEAGRMTPKDDVKIRIAKYFGKSIEEIFF